MALKTEFLQNFKKSKMNILKYFIVNGMSVILTLDENEYYNNIEKDFLYNTYDELWNEIVNIVL